MSTIPPRTTTGDYLPNSHDDVINQAKPSNPQIPTNSNQSRQNPTVKLFGKSNAFETAPIIQQQHVNRSASTPPHRQPPPAHKLQPENPAIPSVNNPPQTSLQRLPIQQNKFGDSATTPSVDPQVIELFQHHLNSTSGFSLFVQEHLLALNQPPYLQYSEQQKAEHLLEEWNQLSSHHKQRYEKKSRNILVITDPSVNSTISTTASHHTSKSSSVPNNTSHQNQHQHQTSQANTRQQSHSPRQNNSQPQTQPQQHLAEDPERAQGQFSNQNNPAFQHQRMQPSHHQQQPQHPTSPPTIIPSQILSNDPASTPGHVNSRAHNQYEHLNRHLENEMQLVTDFEQRLRQPPQPFVATPLPAHHPSSQYRPQQQQQQQQPQQQHSRSSQHVDIQTLPTTHLHGKSKTRPPILGSAALPPLPPNTTSNRSHQHHHVYPSQPHQLHPLQSPAVDRLYTRDNDYRDHLGDISPRGGATANDRHRNRNYFDPLSSQYSSIAPVTSTPISSTSAAAIGGAASLDLTGIQDTPTTHRFQTTLATSRVYPKEQELQKTRDAYNMLLVKYRSQGQILDSLRKEKQELDQSEANLRRYETENTLLREKCNELQQQVTQTAEILLDHQAEIHRLKSLLSEYHTKGVELEQLLQQSQLHTYNVLCQNDRLVYHNIDLSNKLEESTQTAAVYRGLTGVDITPTNDTPHTFNCTARSSQLKRSIQFQLIGNQPITGGPSLSVEIPSDPNITLQSDDDHRQPISTRTIHVPLSISYRTVQFQPLSLKIPNDLHYVRNICAKRKLYPISDCPLLTRCILSTIYEEHPVFKNRIQIDQDLSKAFDTGYQQYHTQLLQQQQQLAAEAALRHQQEEEEANQRLLQDQQRHAEEEALRQKKELERKKRQAAQRKRRQQELLRKQQESSNSAMVSTGAPSSVFADIFSFDDYPSLPTSRASHDVSDHDDDDDDDDSGDDDDDNENSDDSGHSGREHGDTSDNDNDDISFS